MRLPRRMGWAILTMCLAGPGAWGGDDEIATRQEASPTVGTHEAAPRLVEDLRQRLRSLGTSDSAPAPESGMPATDLTALPAGQQGGLKTSGQVKVLALLLEFDDHQLVYDAETIRSSLFGDGNPAHFPFDSLKNYYQRESYGQLEIEGEVLEYRVPRNRPTNTGGDWEKNQIVEALIAEALRYHDPSFDFAPYDNDGDGEIDYVVVIWAGPADGGANYGLWWGQNFPRFITRTVALDGKRLGDHSWQPEGTDCNPGTIIHETGHALGLPDLWDYDSNPPRGGVSSADMMGMNGKVLSVFSKFLLGWITPTVHESGNDSYALRPIRDYPDALLFARGTAASDVDEFFLVENRDGLNEDRGNGLLIWHVDATVNPTTPTFVYNNSFTAHKLLRLMEADGLEHIESLTGTFHDDDYYRAGDAFGPASLPSSTRYRRPSYMGIRRIEADSAAAGALSFEVFSSEDTTGPTGRPSPPQPDPSSLSSNNVRFTWTHGDAADPESGITGEHFQVESLSGGRYLDAWADWRIQEQTVFLANGAWYRARVRSQNGAGGYTAWSDWSPWLFVDTSAPGGRVSGKVTGASGAPLANVSVEILDAAGTSRGSGSTDSAGIYISSGMPSGIYYARASSTSGYVGELYDDVSCPSGFCSPTGGTPITVIDPNTTTGIDFALAVAGRVSGKIKSTTGVPLANVSLYVYDSAGNSAGYATTDASGSYITSGVASGTYYVRTYNSLGYVDEAYNDMSCPGGSCSNTTGTPVSVAAPSTTSGIDFALAPGGRVTGGITDASGAPLPNVWVSFYDSAGAWRGSGSADARGVYTSAALPSGTYYARTYNSGGYGDELYDNLPCFGSCSPTGGTPISVAAPNTTTGIDFALALGGRISGTVRNTAGAPLMSVNVYFYDSAGNWAGSATTDASGTYVSGGLSTGTYYVRTSNSSGYLDEVFDDITCPSSTCGSTTGTPIGVTAPNTTTGVDFTLAPGGRITGRITDASGAPLPSVSVSVYDSAGAFRGSGYSDSSGIYISSGLPSGTYYAETGNPSGYLDELYDNIPCAGGRCAVTSGTPITVTVPDTTAGIDFVLGAGGRISGMVRSTAGTPLVNVSVSFHDSGGKWAGYGNTNASGNYTSSGLSSGTYYVRTYNSAGYVDELYDNVACPNGSCSTTTGTPVSVTVSSTTMGIDFVLAPGGRMSGRISDASGAPLPGVTVWIVDATGATAGSGYTGASGDYVSGALPAGTYYARTSNSQGYLDELYDDVFCPGGSCGLAQGAPIAVAVSNTTTGIDFVLGMGGRISGTVRDAGGVPLANVGVLVSDSAGRPSGSTFTDLAGRYTSRGLPPGMYYVRTSNSQGYLDEAYDDVPCPDGSCGNTTGMLVSVSATSVTTGIDFALIPGGRISGRITDTSGAPVANVSLRFLDAAGIQRGSGSSDALGVYTSNALPSGTYYARTENSRGYLDELYNDVPCPRGSCSVTAGTPIAVTVPSTVTGIDFVLASGGGIGGRVINVDGASLVNVAVDVLDSSGSLWASGSTDATGWYTTSGLPAGYYYARTRNSRHYLDELYDDVPCPGGACSLSAGSLILVNAGATTSAINFILDPEVLVSISDATVAEGDAGTTPASLTVTLTSTGELPVTNVALGKTATQSSTTAGGVASRAVDGNSDGAHANGSVSHTAEQTRPYWQVDLGTAHWIGEVRIYNRTDCCAERLSNFDVMASLDGATWTSIYVAQAAGRPTTVHFGGRVSRFVRVRLRGTNYLSLAEVEVMGTPLPSRPVSVDYATGDGTAFAESDYEATSGTLTFAPGQATATITVPIIGDVVQEDAETFSVVISNPAGAVLAGDTATGTIAASDAPGSSVDAPPPQ